MTRRSAGAVPEEAMDPMAGAVPGGPPASPVSAPSSAPPPSPAGPPAAGPVQRKVAGVIPGAGGGAHSGGVPKMKSSAALETDEEEFDGPWYKNREKQKLAAVVTVFVLTFSVFGLPSLAGLIDKSWERKVKHIVRLEFIFGDGYRNTNVAEAVEVNPGSLVISKEGGTRTDDQQGPDVFYVMGTARNISGDPLQEVEIIFKLYDQAGTELGEALDYTNQLGPGVEWSFRAPCGITSTNIHRARLDRLIVR